MSKSKLLSTISSELEEINNQIDWKVIKGIPYRREAKRHKLLLSMLADIKRQPEVRAYSFLSFK